MRMAIAQGPVRTYADASVFGGAFDEEFEAPSQAFFDEVREGRHILVSSGPVEAELEPAPAHVRALFAELEPLMQLMEFTPEGVELQQAYMKEGIVSPQWANDALHVATATVAGCPVIVSWNFRHIVHWQKIPLYNAVNTLRGYDSIAIHSPREVIGYAE